MLRQTHIATRVRSMLTKESLYVIMSYSESKLASNCQVWEGRSQRSRRAAGLTRWTENEKEAQAAWQESSAVARKQHGEGRES